MNGLPAINGWLWIREGFALFRRKPNELLMMFLLYWGLNVLISGILPVGGFLLLILHPVFVTAFMLACAKVDIDQPLHPKLLFAYLFSPKFKRLAGLGLCYLLALCVAGVAMYLFADDSLIASMLKANNGTMPDDPAMQIAFVKAFFFGFSLFIVLIFPLWFAAPLIAWQDMSIGKAVFFSFFSVVRAIKAFLLYFVAWGLIIVFVFVNLAAILSLLHVQSQAWATIVLIPCMLLLGLLLHCS